MTELVTPGIVGRVNSHVGQKAVNAAVSGQLNTTNYSRLADNPQLDDSFSGLTAHLGVRQVAVPRSFTVKGFAPSDSRVHLAAGNGYSGDESNPNPVGLGLFTFIHGLAVATTWADAPSVLFSDRYGMAVGALACIWQELRFGPVDEMVGLFLEHLNTAPTDLYAYVSPGARTNFVLDKRGRDRALEGPCAPFGACITPHESPQGYQLDLTGLVIELLKQAKIPEGQIEVAEGDTMSTPGLPSKRRTEGLIYPSGIAAIALVD